MTLSTGNLPEGSYPIEVSMWKKGAESDTEVLEFEKINTTTAALARDKVQMKCGIKPGKYYLKAKVDPGKDICEAQWPGIDLETEEFDVLAPVEPQVENPRLAAVSLKKLEETTMDINVTRHVPATAYKIDVELRQVRLLIVGYAFIGIDEFQREFQLT